MTIIINFLAIFILLFFNFYLLDPDECISMRIWIHSLAGTGNNIIFF